MGRAFLFLVLLMSAPSRAEPYGLALVDELKQLDRPALEQAAAPLLKRGAAVAVVLVRHGDERDVIKQLSQLGLWGGRQITPAGLLLYISLEPRYSELRVGARFSLELPPPELEKIRIESLNPSLREQHYQQAVVDSLTTLEARLSHSLSLKDWMQRATVALMAVVFLKLVGFWGWLSYLFWDSRPGKALLLLWSLTPIARKRERQRLERCRQQNLGYLQERSRSLAEVRPRLGILTQPEQQVLEQLQAEADQASNLSANELVALMKRIDLEKEQSLNRLRLWQEADKQLETAQASLQKLKSKLKERKKTRQILETSAFQDLQAELTQERELRERLAREGANQEEATRSQERCQQLAQRAQSLWNRYNPPQKSPPPLDTSSWADSTSSNSSYSSSTSEDRPSYEPPASYDESRAGGDW